MAPNHGSGDPNRFKVKVLFGLFEADATGTLAIGAAILVFVLAAAGRCYALW